MAPEDRSFGTEISRNRVSNHEFTPEQRAAMMAELRAGKSQSQVARNFGTSQGTVSKTKRRWENHQDLRSRPRKGRPKKLSALQIVRINSYINRHRDLTWQDVLIELDLDVSIRTLKRRLHSHWRRKWRSRRRIFLSEEDAKERLEHCQFWVHHLDDYIKV
jgi:transposase